MWFMGYAPSDRLQSTLLVMDYNITALTQEARAEGGQVCPLGAWAAYWFMRSHGIPTPRRRDLEGYCVAMLEAQYGSQGAAIIRTTPGLMDNPVRLTVNARWDAKPPGAPPGLPGQSGAASEGGVRFGRGGSCPDCRAVWG